MKTDLLDDDMLPRNYVFASLLSRIYASLIDFIIQMLSALIFYYATKGSFLSNIFPLLFSVFYFILSESSEKQGSFGKQLLKIKVCNYSYEKIDIAAATTRTIVKYFPSFMFFIVSILQFNDTGIINNAPFSTKYNFIEIIGLLLMIQIYCSAFFNSKKQGTHDKIAKTYVVKEII